MDLTALLAKIIMFVFLISLGFILSRKGDLTNEFNKGVSKLIVTLFIPASVLSSVLKDKPVISKPELWNIVIVMFAITVTGYILAYIYARIRKQDEHSRLVEMLMAVTNVLFIGMPILSAAYGSRTDFYVGISCIPFNLILYSYGIWRLRGEGGGLDSLKNISNPCFISSVLALLIFTLDIPVPEIATNVISSIGAATVPVSMLLIGSTMGKSNPASELKKAGTWIFMFVRIIVGAAACYFVSSLLTDNGLLIATCTILGGCPCGTVVTPLALQYGYDAEYSSKMITISTLVSIIVLPLMLVLLF